jgi:hypothetical protein
MQGVDAVAARRVGVEVVLSDGAGHVGGEEAVQRVIQARHRGEDQAGDHNPALLVLVDRQVLGRRGMQRSWVGWGRQKVEHTLIVDLERREVEGHFRAAAGRIGASPATLGLLEHAATIESKRGFVKGRMGRSTETAEED